MKTTSMIRYFIAVVALSVMPTTAVAMRSSPDAEFERAMKKGAQARLEIRVVDDEGAPVSNATVKVLFNMLTPGGGEIVTVTTDTNGVAVAEGKTNVAIRYRVEKEGYYKSEDGMDMYNMSHRYEVKDGRWQPWGMKKEIVLLPVKNPQAQRAGTPGWKRTNLLKEWIGFDLMRYDFIKPYGDGEVSDMEVFFDWDGAWRSREYKGMEMKIRFPGEFAGGYYADKTPGSEYIGVYNASTNGVYRSEFSFYEWEGGRDRQGLVTSWKRQLFDFSKVLVVRTRCKLNEDGALVQANYFQLCKIKFSCGEKGAGIRLVPIYNPTPNDPNLEPK